MNAEKKPTLANIEIYVIVVLFLFMMISLFIQVVARYFFSISFAWVEQVARLLFIWITFAGVSLAAGKSMHLRVSIIQTIFPKRIGPACLFFGDFVAVLFGFYMAYYVFENMYFLMEKGTVFTTVRWLPVWVMYLPGVFGLIGFSLRIIETSIYPTIKNFIKKEASNV